MEVETKALAELSEKLKIEYDKLFRPNDVESVMSSINITLGLLQSIAKEDDLDGTKVFNILLNTYKNSDRTELFLVNGIGRVVELYLSHTGIYVPESDVYFNPETKEKFGESGLMSRALNRLIMVTNVYNTLFINFIYDGSCKDGDVRREYILVDKKDLEVDLETTLGVHVDIEDFTFEKIQTAITTRLSMDKDGDTNEFVAACKKFRRQVNHPCLNEALNNPERYQKDGGEESFVIDDLLRFKDRMDTIDLSIASTDRLLITLLLDIYIKLYIKETVDDSAPVYFRKILKTLELNTNEKEDVKSKMVEDVIKMALDALVSLDGVRHFFK